MNSEEQSNLSIFLQNKERQFPQIPTKSVVGSTSPEQISKSLWKYIYSSKSKMHLHDLIVDNEISNPKSSMYNDITPDNLKSLFTDARTTFCLSHMNIQNPPLAALKKIKRKDIVLYDFNGVYFSNYDSFKLLQKFQGLKYLCLRDCGLIEVPRELCQIAKTLRTLDLSANFIRTIPQDIKWSSLKSLNLSENGICGWPLAIDPERLPRLQHLSLSYNPIEQDRAKKASFMHLLSLDLSYSSLTVFPPWIVNCPKLNYLSLRGNTRMCGFTLRYVQMLTNLQMLDITGVPIQFDDRDLQLPSELELLVYRDGMKQALPPGSYSLILSY